MELADGSKDVVDPEVRAYVSSLVSALGGSGADEDGRYVLGDDALACLRDLKRWLKLYDEKANRLDVARCLAESNLVGGDLLQILAAWPENATDDKIKAKIALACLELLVPLTWPIEKDVQSMTVNHHRHIPYLQLAQLGYKRSIINYDGARILHTAVRIALPPMAQAPGERSARDQGIIKLVLYFLRNIAMIAPSPNAKFDGDENEISRSATIDTFNWQDIFHLLLTISSSMGEDFNVQDVIVMEIIFHLVKGVDIEKLFMDEAQLDMRKTDDLVSLRNKEAGMKRGYQRTAPTRHNRFGTMIWIKRDDAKMTTVSGQDVLVDSTKGLAKMDKSKKYKPPQRAPKGQTGPLDFDTPVTLNAQANKHLRAFVEDFLDSGFNPLFQHIRMAIDREAERIMESHPRQFFFLVSWFLEAERVRRKSKKSTKNKKGEVAEVDSFALVAAVLNQEMFITLNRAMQMTYDNKAWQDLNAAMKCFTQILLTVQEMSESPLEEDQEIAENTLSRIFYEDITHDRVSAIVRFYKDQGFGYLDSATELAHVYLRMLEAYSKQNVDMQVRSRRRTRRKKKAAKEAGEDVGSDVDESEGEDETRAEIASSERKFDFKRFASRFLTQGCVDTFVTFCGFYNDLNADQLKRAHRFFYRVAFKMEMSVMLFRVDIIALFYKMIKGPEGMDPALSSYKEWDELVRQLIKRMTRKIEERPELIVEMLFSKTNSTAHFLEYGYEKQTSSAKPRPAAELEVKGDMSWEDKVGVVVSYLLDMNMGDHLEWVKGQLSLAESERRSWEDANVALASVENDPFADETSKPIAEKPSPPSIVLKADDETRKIAIFKNGHLRLLMTLIGFRSSSISDEEDPTTSWLIPSALSAGQLQESLDLIKKHEFSPPTFDDGKEAEDLIRRKLAATSSRKRAVFDDDDLIDDNDEEDILFPMGGPTSMKPSEALQALKKSRRKRRRDSDDIDTLTDDESLRKLAEARRERELEKQRKIKSDLFVHDSDEESDEDKDREFFEREEKLRKKVNVEVMKELLGIKKSNVSAKAKRKAAAVDSDDDLLPSRASSTISDDILGLGNENGDITDTPLSSPHLRSSQNKRPRLDSTDQDEEDDVEMGMENPIRVGKAAIAVEVNDDDEDEVVVARPVRKRTRGGFISDSSDEE